MGVELLSGVSQVVSLAKVWRSRSFMRVPLVA